MHLASWDVETGERIRRHPGHEEVINCMDVSKRGEEMLVSGSDDGYIGVSARTRDMRSISNCWQIWDTRTKDAVTFIHTDFPITAICLAEAGNELFTGGIDNDIKAWDLRKQAVTYTLLGHTDTVTSLQMSPDNQTLLSNAHDSTVRTWDVRPFAPADRRLQTYDGAPTGQERNLLKASWDPKGEKIAAGSGDQSVAIWETRTGKLLNKLPGHRGAVNDVRFHPLGEPLCKSDTLSFISYFLDFSRLKRRGGIFPQKTASRHLPPLSWNMKLTWRLLVVSASSDRKLIVGELGK
jgi:Prp8 binding protein